MRMITKIKKQCALFLTLVIIATMGFFSTDSDASAKRVKLNKKAVTLKVGQSVKLKIKNTKRKVKWSSNKKKVATVTSKGKVKAKKKGTAKICAKVAGKKLICKVKVKAVSTKSSTQTPAATDIPVATEPTPTEIPVDTKKPEQTSDTQIPGVTYNFRYPSYLAEHFEKHGAEVGAATEEEYLLKANEVISNPDALHKLEAEDSDHVYYIESTNEIVFLSQDGYIRTYFICSGIDYFNKQ